MPLRFTSMEIEQPRDTSIFVSASIPDPDRWDGQFDALAITDAVVALARTFLTAGFHLVSAAHPTIAPLLLYVAAEFPPSQTERVVIYQSQLFEDVLPTATRRFEAEGVGSLIWTDAAEGERPEPGQWDESLFTMRRQMLQESRPVAACFIGGMKGIADEFSMFNELFHGRPTYAVGQPGGEARRISEQNRTDLGLRLISEHIYPTLWRAVLADVERIL